MYSERRGDEVFNEDSLLKFSEAIEGTNISSKILNTLQFEVEPSGLKNTIKA